MNKFYVKCYLRKCDLPPLEGDMCNHIREPERTCRLSKDKLANKHYYYGTVNRKEEAVRWMCRRVIPEKTDAKLSQALFTELQ
ncbi:hypothetical protein TNCV_3641811 [Trichonephila clavipes]|nr:hypothetical protein TNCV_3641811 [Trichonephila clavipes]